MSDATISQQVLGDEWERIFNQLEHDWPIREQVSAALKDANAAFISQYMEPDAFKFVAACERLTKFLGLKIDLQDSEQTSVVQVIQIACAMHENVLNNPTLTRAERTSHYLASSALVPLCQIALNSGVLKIEHWCEMFSCACRAENALSEAAEALGLTKRLDLRETITHNVFGSSGNALDQPAETAAITPSIFCVSKPTTPNGSVLEIADTELTPRSAKLKELALELLNSPSKGAPLGRTHSMPTLSRTRSYSDRANPSMGFYGQGLSTVVEE